MISLPDRPRHLIDRDVAVWAEPVVIPTYPLPPPDRNPLFLEQRVYQGSSGRTYPNPVTDHVADEPVDTVWQAVHLENEYLRVMVLPEIGGRIHVVQDRKTGYDLFYRQNVIKPALVGLLGPWISGGVEFNWPQHHRPSTYMPVAWSIEELADGGAIVWCSEHEPMNRMKGMHGVTLRPDSSVLEVQVRLDNRTPLTQTFLWWANVGVRVHDDYQAFFPPDVSWVADHAKRAVSTFPIARGRYYGIDYGARDEADADLRWYRNIPVPTSYMVMGTDKDFFGGYDHAAQEGYVHWADHTISPGKKLWTWGNHEFGYAWDRELTDTDGPYVELMAGVFTDNQPDFSFLMPGEVRTFRQYWYPIAAIGPAHEANLDVAVSLNAEGSTARLGVAATSARRGTRIRLRSSAGDLVDRTVDVAPDQPFVTVVDLPAGLSLGDLEAVVGMGGLELIRYRPANPVDQGPRPSATEPARPSDIASIEELIISGWHLSQYRHATRRSEDYFREALRRDPSDSRANTAMGEWHLRRGEFELAEAHLRTAIDRLSLRNLNPRDGEAWYLLGLTLRWLGNMDAADEAFGKAGWSGPFQAAADTARAEVASARGDVHRARELVARALASNASLPAARSLQVSLARRSGETALARQLAEQVLRSDPLDARTLHELRLLGLASQAIPGDAQTALDVAHDEARAGLFDDAVDGLERALSHGPARGTTPLVHYTLGWLEERRGDAGAAARHREHACALSADYVFPARLEEIEVLESAIEADPRDPRAPYLLGNLLYDRRRYDDAISLWRRAARLDAGFATVHRNLGIAEFNHLHRPQHALRAYRRAFRANPDDARVLYELDQLRRRLGHPPARRLASLAAELPLVLSRDDLTVEYLTLLNRIGRHGEAIAILSARRFHPWEGGEGLVSRQWAVANRESARSALRNGQPDTARRYAADTMRHPVNLGEGKHLLTQANELQLLMGYCQQALGELGAARESFMAATVAQGDPDVSPGDGPYWQATAMGQLGRASEATDLLEQMLAAARGRSESESEAPYFATSLPTMLVFDDDLVSRARRQSRYLEGLALQGLGRRGSARECFAQLVSEAPDHLEASLRLDELDRTEA